MHLSVIIPAYNEERHIVATLTDINRYLRRQLYGSEVIVVDNASTDRTVQFVEQFRYEMPNLRLLRETRRGKGHAVTSGMLAAAGDYRLFMDADNSTTIDHLDAMMPYFNKGYGVVIGSIAVPGARVARGSEPLWRVILGKLGNKWIQLFAVWGISDTQRGFKVFTVRAVKDIFPRLTVFGWGFDIEVLALARKLGYKIREVPVIWNNSPESKVNIWAYPRTLLDTLKVFWNLRTGVY